MDLPQVKRFLRVDARLAFIALFHLIICPYTKVEESFNMQAIHDVLYHNIHISQYDHLEFPGVVPRTFIAPVFIAALSSPFILFGYVLGISKLIGLYFVRIVIGYTVLVSLQRFTSSVEKHFGRGVSTWLAFIIGSQFHFMFYLSRPLPNIFALALVLWCYHFWLEQNHQWFICNAAFVILIFRGELAILLGLFLLNELIKQRLTIERAVKIAIPAGVVSLVVTVVIDSIFWQRFLWPEGEVLWFNVVLNKSSEWGTSPFLWYFYSALPRALGTSLLFVGIGAYLDRRTWEFLLPAVGFVFLYSFLGHKELRFIIYVFPLLNLAAAIACNRLWENRFKGQWSQILAILAAGHLLANVVLTAFLLSVSSVNYPGGYALSKLHEVEPLQKSLSVHIDNLSAQTGVTRFSQLSPSWEYNKTENLRVPELQRFDYLLVEGKSRHSPSLKPYSQTHSLAGYVEGFSHVHFSYATFPPIKVRSKPAIFILKNMRPESMEYSRKNKRERRGEKREKKSFEKRSAKDKEVERNGKQKVENVEDIASEKRDQSAKTVNYETRRKEKGKELDGEEKSDFLNKEDVNETEDLPELEFPDTFDDEFLNKFLLDSYEVIRDENPMRGGFEDSIEATREWFGSGSDESVEA